MTVLLLFHFGFHLFLFLLWLPWLRIPKLCWIKMMQANILVLFLILVGILSAFLHWEWFRFVINGFYHVEGGSLYSYFLDRLYKKWVLDFVKSFFCISWNDHMAFILHFIDVVYYIDLLILKNLCIPGINPTWSWCVILLVYCWVWFAVILWRIFASVFISDISLIFFFCDVLVWSLVFGWWWPHRMSLRVFLPLQFFGRVSEGRVLP